MMRAKWERRSFLTGLLCTGSLLATTAAFGQQGPRGQLSEPVYRVANNEAAAATTPAHPLDPALEMANRALEVLRNDVKDYTCTLVKRERVRGVLNEPEYMFAKIRNGKTDASGAVTTPFSAYLYFLKPEAVKGREVLYVAGANNGKLLAKEGGLKGKLIPSVWLPPDSVIAMNGNLYPITDLGLENLVIKLIERAEREKKAGECDVKFMKNAKINGRVCTLLQLTHAIKRPEYDFHLAQVFIDDELQLPIRYAAYGWPEKEGAQPAVLEEYTYLNLKLNAGLTDADFDQNNPNYKFR